jgi:hypothetical protein
MHDQPSALSDRAGNMRFMPADQLIDIPVRRATGAGFGRRGPNGRYANSPPGLLKKLPDRKQGQRDGRDKRGGGAGRHGSPTAERR